MATKYWSRSRWGWTPPWTGSPVRLSSFVFDGERYVLSETALGSGDRLLRFRSRDPKPAYALLEAELESGGA